MTIAIVFEIFLPIVNGVITTTIDLAENLRERGHTVFFIAPAWKEFQESEVQGIPIHYVPSLQSHVYPGVRFVSPWNRHAEAILRREQCDIVHITGPWLLSWSVMRAARRKGIPVVHTFHTLLYEDNYLYYALKSKRLIPLLRKIVWKYIGLYVKRSDIMTAPSEHACRTLKRHFPGTTVQHIRNGVKLSEFSDFQDFSQLTAAYPGFNRKTVLFVGRLGEEKSVSVMLRAFAAAHLQDSELRLFVIGDGPSRQSYEDFVKQEDLQESVFFLGRLPHDELLHSGLYQHAKALITASTTENQPITVIEAIACGTPIIIPDVEGINELLCGNGLSFPAGDTEAFAEQLLKLTRDQNLYETCTHGGEVLRSEFTGSRVAERFESLYAEALGR